MPLLTRTQHAARSAGPEASSATGKRVLFVVDSAPGAEEIRKWLSTSGGNLDAAQVELLSLMPRPEVVRTRGIFIETVRRHLRAEGEARLSLLKTALDELGIRHEVRIELSNDAGTVDRIARETACDLIVMASALPTETRKRWISATGFGVPSLATRVAELAECPTLVLKHRFH